MAMMITSPITTGVVSNKMSETTNKTEEKSGVPGYTSTKVGDHTVITPKDKKASVYQKVTPREQYAVARDVANRAINEINEIRSRRPSSFTGGINDANIAARMQAAETYGDTLPGGRGYSRSRRSAYDIADSYRNVLATAPKPPTRPEPKIPDPKPDPRDPSQPGKPKPKPPRESHDAWINQQYKELLGREAGTEGLNYWTGDLNRGQTKDQVRSNIMLSDEYKNRLKLVTDYKTKHGTNPAEDWLDARVGPGGKWLMEGYGNKSEDTSTSASNFQTTWKPTANYDGGGYEPGQFGRGPKYAEYEKMFANSIAEGFTLEEAMKLSKTATSYDWEQAFGTADQWKKIGGGSKSGHGQSAPKGSRLGKTNPRGANRGARSVGGSSGNKHNRKGKK